MPNKYQSPSLLDHIWLNFHAYYNIGILLSDSISDHCPIFVFIPTLNTEVTDKINISFQSHRKENMAKFQSEVSMVDWDHISIGSKNENEIDISLKFGLI